MAGEFSELARRVEAALRDEADPDDTITVVGELGDLVGEACTGEDAARIAQLRYRIERLRSRVDRRADDERRARMMPALDALSRTLTAALTALELRSEGTRWEQEVRVLRERIFEALDEPARPRDLALRFEVDHAQAVRALDDLRKEGLVRKSRPATGDRRATVYSRVDASPALADVIRLKWSSDEVADKLGTQIKKQSIRGLLVVGDKHKVRYWNPPWETSDDALGDLANLLSKHS